MIVLYQWWFAIAYIFSQLLGHAVGNLIFYCYFLLSTALPILSPVGNSKLKSTRPPNEISVHMAYPYFHFWKSMISMDKSISFKFPSCKILYMVPSFITSPVDFVELSIFLKNLLIYFIFFSKTKTLF